MKLTVKEVEKIANLARLGLNDQEKEKFADQLSLILDYVDQLKEVDTTNVKPIAQITGLENVMRNDKIEALKPEMTKNLISQAPEAQDNLIKTSAVFE